MPTTKKKYRLLVKPGQQLSRRSRSGFLPGTQRVNLSPELSSVGGRGLSVDMSVLCHEMCHAERIATLNVAVEG
jgi:hypothetical protein